MAKRGKSGGSKPISQKLGTGHMKDVGGMDLSSKLEKAATSHYAGHSLGEVRHGSKGMLAGTGAKKNAKVPQ